ncbi:hypothetical protein N7523_006637 [Penicillium sp. IBT 18751x]|nr:hypothetical protein N7523_006637 [Penicillium sp. IBT 18751x]
MLCSSSPTSNIQRGPQIRALDLVMVIRSVRSLHTACSPPSAPPSPGFVRHVVRRWDRNYLAAVVPPYPGYISESLRHVLMGPLEEASGWEA